MDQTCRVISHRSSGNLTTLWELSRGVRADLGRLQSLAVLDISTYGRGQAPPTPRIEFGDPRIERADDFSLYVAPRVAVGLGVFLCDDYVYRTKGVGNFLKGKKPYVLCLD
jgi:hypothetical protein